MKQGLQNVMPILLDGVNCEDVAKVEFIFKDCKKKKSKPIKTAVFPGEVSCTECIYYVPWTREETYKINAGDKFYLDTRITLKVSNYQPETDIVEIIMKPTLFDEDEVIS